MKARNLKIPTNDPVFVNPRPCAGASGSAFRRVAADVTAEGVLSRLLAQPDPGSCRVLQSQQGVWRDRTMRSGRGGISDIRAVALVLFFAFGASAQIGLGIASPASTCRFHLQGTTNIRAQGQVIICCAGLRVSSPGLCRGKRGRPGGCRVHTIRAIAHRCQHPLHGRHRKHSAVRRARARAIRKQLCR